MKQRSQGSAPEKITIKGNGDVSCYPDLLKLVKIVSGGEIPVFSEVLTISL